MMILNYKQRFGLHGLYNKISGFRVKYYRDQRVIHSLITVHLPYIKARHLKVTDLATCLAIGKMQMA